MSRKIPVFNCRKCGFLLLLAFLSSCSNRIQKTLLTQVPVSAISSLEPAGCEQFMNYAPDTGFPSHTPMRYVRVNVHIFNNSAGTHNFSEDEAPAFVRGFLDAANRQLLDNQPMALPEGNSTPVLPIKYQFVLFPDSSVKDDDGIYFHYDNEFAYVNKRKPAYDPLIFEKYKTQADKALNIFMLEHHPDSIRSPTYKASVDGMGLSNWLKVVGLHQHAYDTTRYDDGTHSVSGPHYNIGILNHEAGHTLGLAHTWNMNDGCDDTPQNPGCWDASSPACRETGIYSNNMMDYNNCQCALSPCQLAKIHFNFSKEVSTQRRLLLPVWCEYKADSSIRIPWGSRVEWRSAKDLEGNLIIENGAELSIYCEVSLPAGAKIIVKSGGKLTLNGCRITNRCGQQWQGIEVWKKKKKAGMVAAMNRAVLENVAGAGE